MTSKHSNKSILSLPTKHDVTKFREKRLLLHLHEQLVDQVDQNPRDWQYHFHLANLLAFGDDGYSYYKNRDIDILKSENHYIKSLKILQNLHEIDYNQYINKINIMSTVTPINGQITPLNTNMSSNTNNVLTLDYGCVLYEDEEEDKAFNSNELIDISIPVKFGKKQKKSKKKINKPKINTKVQRNSKHTNNALSLFKNNITINKPDNNSKNKKNKKKKIKVKKRKLFIVVLNDKNKVKSKLKCVYKSALSSEEIQIEKEKQLKKKKINKIKNKKKKKKKLINKKKKNSASTKHLKVDLSATYFNAEKRKNKHTKQPSIIQALNIDVGLCDDDIDNVAKSDDIDIDNDNNLNINIKTAADESPISIIQSESFTSITSTIASIGEYTPSYSVPTTLVKGYTECFFGYGKYLHINNRLKESIHNLLECASWYDDSFVDPSCLTSLVLPPQFLFQDSVKKRHCLNFKTLTNYINKVLNQIFKINDKQFKDINMKKYINEYDKYKYEYQQRNLMKTSLTNNLSDDYGLSLNTNLLNNMSNISNISNYSFQSDRGDISPAPPAPPTLAPTGTGSGYHIRNQLINYDVYPQFIQDLVEEYMQLCSNYYKLGLLLIDFFRYAEAKKTFSLALKIFRKLKIKPSLYDDIMVEIRAQQCSSFVIPSGRERAEKLSKQKTTPASRSSHYKDTQSPSFTFSFSFTNTDNISTPQITK